jgi:drug/metabolite transporter (DMT)-like permease
MISLGLLASFSTIIFKSGKSLATKMAASETDSYITSFATRVVGLFVTGFILLILSNNIIIPTEYVFWISLVLNSISLAGSTILFTIGLRESDISIVAPLMSFIPLATMIPAIFILNQIPTIISVLGILLVTAGAYIIKYSGKRKRYIQAIKIVV